MWGAPGTLLATKLLFEFSKNQQYVPYIESTGQNVIGRWKFSSDIDAFIWTQDLYGQQLTWHEGPLVKPFVICHGTAANGYAFLKLYTRTGDPRWLSRARAFAMHAIEQSNNCRKQYGRRRYELFTGDLGLAQYLWSCIKANDKWPLIDIL